MPKYLEVVRKNTEIFSACWEAALHHLRLFHFSEKANRLRLPIPDFFLHIFILGQARDIEWILTDYSCYDEIYLRYKSNWYSKTRNKISKNKNHPPTCNWVSLDYFPLVPFN